MPRKHSYDSECDACRDCPEAIAQWATFGERDDNWFQRNFGSDKGIAERSSDPTRGRRDE